MLAFRGKTERERFTNLRPARNLFLAGFWLSGKVRINRESGKNKEGESYETKQ